MATKTSLVYTVTDANDKEIQKTVTNISPGATAKQARTFAQKLAALTDNTYHSSAIVERTETAETNLPWADAKFYFATTVNDGNKIPNDDNSWREYIETGGTDALKRTIDDFTKETYNARDVSDYDGRFYYGIDVSKAANSGLFTHANGKYTVEMVVFAEHCELCYCNFNTSGLFNLGGAMFCYDTDITEEQIAFPHMERLMLCEKFFDTNVFLVHLDILDVGIAPESAEYVNIPGQLGLWISGSRSVKPWLAGFRFYDSTKQYEG